jgi:hypothetical protein
LPSFLGSQSYFDRYLWRTTVTWDLGGNARAYPREKENIFHTRESGANPEWFVVDALANFYGVTGYGDALGGATVYEITPQINLAWRGGFPVASGLVRHC